MGNIPGAFGPLAVRPDRVPDNLAGLPRTIPDDELGHRVRAFVGEPLGTVTLSCLEGRGGFRWPDCNIILRFESDGRVWQVAVPAHGLTAVECPP